MNWLKGTNEMSTTSTELLDTMNVPEGRKNIINMANVRWLLRNLRIQNDDNPQLKELLQRLVNLHKEVDANREPFVL